MKERPGYGDAEAKRIIERAAEIDAEQGRRLDAPALREIALQAGISPLAVDEALREHETSTAAATVDRRPLSKRIRALLAVAAIMVGLLLLASTYLVPRAVRSPTPPVLAPAPPVTPAPTPAPAPGTTPPP